MLLEDPAGRLSVSIVPHRSAFCLLRATCYAQEQIQLYADVVLWLLSSNVRKDSGEATSKNLAPIVSCVSPLTHGDVFSALFSVT